MIIIKTKTIICRDTEEVVTGVTKKDCYEKYLNTKHWRNLRLNIAYKHNNRCQMCSKLVKRGYHIHHLTYENIGNEKASDLMFLCESCHNKIHNGKIKDKTIKKVNRSPNVPKNYIQSDNYKKKTQLNKMKYLCNCLNNHKVFSDKDRESVIKYIENLISKKN